MDMRKIVNIVMTAAAICLCAAAVALDRAGY